MKYETLHKIGEFGVCKASNTPNYYVSAYSPEKGRMNYWSLHTYDLENAISQVRSLASRGVKGDPRSALVEKPIQIVAEALSLYSAHAAKLASAEATGIAIARLNRLIGGANLTNMKKSDFDAFRDAALKEGISLSTVARTLTVLRSACNHAVAERRMPAEHVPKIPYYWTKNQARSAEPKGRIMTPIEIAAVVDQLDFLHLLVAVVYLLNTASRVGAILDAQADQIDTHYNVVDLNPKGRAQTDKYRPVLPITETLAPWTVDLPPGPLVVWRQTAVGEIDTGFSAACKRARLAGDENTYSLRHSVSRYMLQQGVHRSEIAQWLGHTKPDATPETTLIYSPYAPDYLRGAKAATENFVREIASHCHKHDLLMPPWRQ